MKVAVITPYYKEAAVVLERCHQSVVKQTHKDVQHIMVADGVPNNDVASWNCTHLILPNSGDYGDTPRGIGAASAAAQGFDAICFVDADCWIEPDHIEELLAEQRRTSAQVVTCPRNLYGLVDEFLMVDRESDGVSFNDTNCYLFTRPAFPLLRVWMFKDKQDAMVGDRLLWKLITDNKISLARTLKATLNYSTTFAAHYINAGQPAPARSRLMVSINGKNHFITYGEYLKLLEQQKKSSNLQTSSEPAPTGTCSWDCFDTLVARRFYHPTSVFDEVARRLGDPGFKQRRIEAERQSDGTYAGIYRNLPGIDPEVEFQVELEHCFGIVENLSRVKDGDLIVSDMYLEPERVEKLLRSCGLTKNVKVYVTPAGKRSGAIWSKLGTIELHTGDNEEADVRSAQRAGIRSSLYTGCHLTAVEKQVHERQPELAHWMRYVRLRCPFSGDRRQLWLDQAQLNLPVLALAALELPDKPIAFTYRDCVFWQHLHEALTGRTSRILHSSRRAYSEATDEYRSYVLEQARDAAIVDLQGTGGSVKRFFETAGQPAPELIYICGPTGEGVRALARSVSDAIERHNCSTLGTLVGWHGGPVRAECEFPSVVVETQAAAQTAALEAASWFKIKRDAALLQVLLEQLTGNFTDRNVAWTPTH